MDKDITGLMVYYYEVCKRKLWCKGEYEMINGIL